MPDVPLSPILFPSSGDVLLVNAGVDASTCEFNACDDEVEEVFSPVILAMVIGGIGGKIPPHCVTAAAICNICNCAELIKNNTQNIMTPSKIFMVYNFVCDSPVLKLTYLDVFVGLICIPEEGVDESRLRISDGAH